jgi:RNA polymerase sigma-70 factor (ECF subfamily)
MMSPEQERACIQRARTDPTAFGPLYDQYFPRVHAYVRYRVYDLHDAENVIADVFLRAIQNSGRFRWRHTNSFAAWLFRIARNRVIDYRRQHRRVPLLIEPEDDLVAVADQALSPEDVVAQQGTFYKMRTLIATLSPRRQEIITLRFYAGLHNREIARVLGLDERTVAAHLCRALQDLETMCTAPAQPAWAVEAAI